MAFDWNQFKAILETENSHFRRFKRSSSLDALVGQIKGRTQFPDDVKRQIREAIAFIPYDKQRKYAQTLANVSKQIELKIPSFPFAVPANLTMKFTKFELFMGTYTGYNALNQTKSIDLMPREGDNSLPGAFVHEHRLSWESSNGNTESLANVRTREHVRFQREPQSPPFNHLQDPDQDFRAPGPPFDTNCKGTKGATSGIDTHSTKPPSLITAYPRVAGTLLAEQTYEYSVDDGVNWDIIDGSHFLLEKSVFRRGADWIFSFSKRNWAPYNPKGFDFKVEYLITPPPEYMQRTLADFNIN
jgi:hypothetical protein